MLANGGTIDTAPLPTDAPDTEPLADYDFDMHSQQQEEFLPRLLRAWINERNAPELLPFQFDLVQDTIELLDNQVPSDQAVLTASHLLFFCVGGAAGDRAGGWHSGDGLRAMSLPDRDRPGQVHPPVLLPFPHQQGIHSPLQSASYFTGLV